MAQTTPPSPAAEAPIPEATPAPDVDGRTDGFFDWMRRLRIERGNGWIGGVCLGIADRIGVDVVIVRGIAVVLALIGAPAILAYALAWLLLPDATDRIHLQELIRGRFDPAIVGIGLLILASLLPVTQGVWWLGYNYWGAPYWDGGGIARAIWTIVILAAITGLIIWAARRGERTESVHTGPVFDEQEAEAAVQTAIAEAMAGPNTPAEPRTTTASDAPSLDAAIVVGAAAAAPVEPPQPSDAAEFEAWKVAHAQWKIEHDAWRTAQAASAKALRQQRAAENQVRAAERAVAAEIRYHERLRRSPRVGGAFHASVIGLALIAGAASALWASSDPDLADYLWTIGLAFATLVLAFALVIAGVRGRRSAMLGTFALLLTLVTVGTAFIPRGEDIVLTGSASPTADTTVIVAPVGDFWLDLSAYGNRAESGADPASADITMGLGNLSMTLEGGLTVQIEAEMSDGSVYLYLVDADSSDTVGAQIRPVTEGGTLHRAHVGADGDPDVIVHVTSARGDVSIWDYTAQANETDQN